MLERDKRDASRSDAPMKAAPDAVMVDTSEMNIEQAFEHVMNIIREKLEQ
jgi:cytidylate kinase